jgi:hypothetical protein
MIQYVRRNTLCVLVQCCVRGVILHTLPWFSSLPRYVRRVSLYNIHCVQTYALAIRSVRHIRTPEHIKYFQSNGR